MKRYTRFHVALLVSGLFLFAGCADVSVRKIPSAVDYEPSDWKKADQERADAMEGFRFPTVRPWLVVNKEFELTGDTTFVRGTIALDGRLLSLDFPSSKDTSWGVDTLKNIEKLSEVYIAKDSPLLTNNGNAAGSAKTQGAASTTGTPTPGGAATGSSAGATTTAALKYYALPNAVVTSNQKPTHLAKAGTPLTVTLTITKSALSVENCSLGPIRGLYLLPVVDGKVGSVNEGYLLPIALYSPSADGINGVLSMTNGVFSKKLKAGGYVFAVRFFRADAGVMQEYVAYNPVSPLQLSVAQDWNDSTDPWLGAPDLKTNGPVRVNGITLTRTPKNIEGPLEKIDLAFSCKIGDLKTSADGKTLPASTVDGVGLITAMGLVPDSGGQPNFDEAVRLPFTPNTKKDEAGIVDYVGTVEYERKLDSQRPNSKSLHAGNYYLAVWMNTEDAGGLQTTRFVSDGTVLRVSSFSTTLPAAPNAPATPPAGSSPRPGGGSPAPAAPVGRGATPVDSSGSTTDASVANSQNLPGGHVSGAFTSDPGTGLVVPINDLFGLVMLPDYDHMYAVRPKARLSDVAIDISPKYGWLLERFNLRIDNKAIADFLFKQVDKTLDLARDYVRVTTGLLAPVTAASPAAASTGQDAGTSTAQTEGAGGSKARSAVAAAPRPAIFRLHRRIIATPGLFPLLTQAELARTLPKDSTKKETMIEPWSLFRLQKRTEIIVELVTFASRSSPSAAPVSENDHPEPAALEKLVRAFATENFKDLEIVEVKTIDEGEVVTVKLASGVPSTRSKELQKALNGQKTNWNCFSFTVEIAP